MATNLDEGRIRLYLLGGLPEEQSTALEEEYVRREEELDRVASAEDDLIADYLEGRLTREERERFDQHYLASPVHRRRVAVARQLRLAAQHEVKREEAASPISSFIRAWFAAPFAWKGALAAALLLVIAVGAVWMVRARFETQSAAPTSAATTMMPTQPSAHDAAPPSPSELQPVVVAISLSPAGVRGAENSPPVTIAPGTDRVRINLESDGPPHAFSKARAVVQTVSGREVWTGPATAEASSAGAPVFARIEVPADRLAPDDYIVTLFEILPSGSEIEGLRYFMRIRSR